VNPPGTALLWELIARTATVSVSATCIAMAIGIPAGTALGLLRFRGRRAAAAVVNTGMALPTVVVGLVAALVLFRSGPLGSLDLIYTVRGMIIAQVLIAAPLIINSSCACGSRRVCRCWPP
jgi:tungstate transport system permease protein